MRLILVRHGETVQNDQRIMQGHFDGALNEVGWLQAKAIANRLRNEQFDIIYSSDLSRAANTAKEIGKFHPNVPIQFSEQIREIDLGSWSGKPVSIKKVESHPMNAESWDQVYERACSFLKTALHKHAADTILIVAHGGTNRMIHRAITGISLEEAKTLPWGNTAIDEFDIYEDGSHKIHLRNCVKHLALNDLINIKQITTMAYNESAEQYAKYFDQNLARQLQYEIPTFIKLVPKGRILDLGCGAGSHSEYFMQQGLDVKAIDLSEEMVALAKHRRVNAEVMDIERLTFKQETFDGIWAVTSLLHIQKKNVPDVITALHNILKQRGVLYVCIFEGESEGLEQDAWSGRHARYFSYWREDEFLHAVSSKFELIEKKRVAISNKRTFLEFFLRKR